MSSKVLLTWLLHFCSYGSFHLPAIFIENSKDYQNFSYFIFEIHIYVPYPRQCSPGFYFSIWVFGWGSIQKIPQKEEFFSKKWGFIQEKPQKLDFSHYLGLYSRVGLQYCGYGSLVIPVNEPWNKHYHENIIYMFKT